VSGALGIATWAQRRVGALEKRASEADGRQRGDGDQAKIRTLRRRITSASRAALKDIAKINAPGFTYAASHYTSPAKDPVIHVQSCVERMEHLVEELEIATMQPMLFPAA